MRYDAFFKLLGFKGLIEEDKLHGEVDCKEIEV